jgi:membrane-associated phospholipid phosphatase
MRDSQWLVPAAILLVVQHTAAWIISFAVQFPARPPTISYMLAAAVLSLASGLVLFLGKLWRLWNTGEEHPIERLRIDTDWPAVATYFVGFQFVALQIAALTWLKEMIPYVLPYWADPTLAAADRALLGTDAWRLVPNALVRPLDFLYPWWAAVKSLALILMLSLPASQLKSRALLSYFLNVGLIAVIGEYVLASGGPIFYDQLVGGHHFAELTARTRQYAPIASLGSHYLWTVYVSHDGAIASGISAMPSMHVATTVWTALVLSRLWPRFRYLIWSWWVIILAGSVALGWHYLMDGVVASIGGVLCWHLAPYILRLSLRSGLAKPAMA